MLASILPLLEPHESNLRIPFNQTQQCVMPCDCKVHFQSTWDMIQHLRYECTETSKKNFYCHECKAWHRGPASRTLRKTVSLLRRLSGTKKHGRNTSVDSQTPHKRPKFSVIDDTGYSNPLVSACWECLTPQELDSASLAAELAAFEPTAELACLSSEQLMNESQLGDRPSTQVGSILYHSSPTSSVSSSQASQPTGTTFSSPLYGHSNYSSLFDESPISSIPTSTISPFPSLDITTAPAMFPFQTNYSQNDYQPHDDQTSWLFEDEETLTCRRDANKISGLHSPAEVFDSGRVPGMNARLVVPYCPRDCDWPFPNRHHQLPIRTQAAPNEGLFGEIRSSIGSPDRVRRFLGSKFTEASQCLAATTEKEVSSTARDPLKLSLNTSVGSLSRRNAVRDGKSGVAAGSDLSDTTTNESDRCTFPDCGYQPIGTKNRSGRLKRHRMIHENLEKIPCPQSGCNASFTAGRSDNLRSHLINRHHMSPSEVTEILASENTSVTSRDSQKGPRRGGVTPVDTKILYDGCGDPNIWRDMGPGAFSASGTSSDATEQLENDILEMVGECSRPSDIGPTGWNGSDWHFPGHYR